MVIRIEIDEGSGEIELMQGYYVKDTFKSRFWKCDDIKDALRRVKQLLEPRKPGIRAVVAQQDRNP